MAQRWRGRRPVRGEQGVVGAFPLPMGADDERGGGGGGGRYWGEEMVRGVGVGVGVGARGLLGSHRTNLSCMARTRDSGAGLGGRLLRAVWKWFPPTFPPPHGCVTKK